jgi:hypothetical protein
MIIDPQRSPSHCIERETTCSRSRVRPKMTNRDANTRRGTVHGDPVAGSWLEGPSPSVLPSTLTNFTVDVSAGSVGTTDEETAEGFCVVGTTDVAEMVGGVVGATDEETAEGFCVVGTGTVGTLFLTVVVGRGGTVGFTVDGRGGGAVGATVEDGATAVEDEVGTVEGAVLGATEATVVETFGTEATVVLAAGTVDGATDEATVLVAFGATVVVAATVTTVEVVDEVASGEHAAANPADPSETRAERSSATPTLTRVNIVPSSSWLVIEPLGIPSL